MTGFTSGLSMLAEERIAAVGAEANPVIVAALRRALELADEYAAQVDSDLPASDADTIAAGESDTALIVEGLIAVAFRLQMALDAQPCQHHADELVPVGANETLH